MQSVSHSRFSLFGTQGLLVFLAMVVVGLGGCATRPPADDPDAVADYVQTNDPLEPTNRVFYAVNNGLDTVILRPAAQAYRYVVPGRVREGVHNVLANIGSPVQLANDMLEGKPRRAGDTSMRFVINTTAGLLGIFDVAKGWGYPAHDADFGMTMASWGVPEGPFLFLPVLGPTDPRDAAGFGVDIALDPFTWVGGPHNTGLTVFNWTRYGLNAVDSRERVLDPVDQIKKTALDPYATFRSLYRQHRHAQIETLRNDNRATVPVWFSQPADASVK
ncbi:MAG: phospholipid-binding lipoprotein MlaA [Acetobacteraceae bacterium]|jgi:phospholipid-binding lipoprotein MlaA|nr:phospholipid-binding lipoprotein MlaA [Acetobacteraceae bacterium]